MVKLNFVMFTLGLCAVSTGACGGGSAAGDAAIMGGDGPVADGRIVIDGGPAWDGARPGDFISGDVDGVPVRVETDTMAGTVGLGAGRIWVNAGSSTPAWNVYVPNSVGTSACPPDWIALFAAGGNPRSDGPGASCSVTVTRAAPALGDVIEGTFSATLTTIPPSEPRTAVVTNGAFHVTRNFQ
jgi:hypothetical protein